MKLNPRNFGLVGGVMWGVSILLMTLVSMGTGYGTDFLTLMGSIYPGYSVGFFGAGVGLVYGFLDAFIGFYIFAWLYNWMEGKT